MTLSSFLYSVFVHLFSRLVDRGEYEDQEARQCLPPIEKGGSGPTDLTMLTRSRSLLHRVWNIRIPGFVPPCTRSRPQTE